MFSLAKLINCWGEVKPSLCKATLIALSTITVGIVVESIAKPAMASGLYDSTPVETLSVDSRNNIYPIGQDKVFSSVLESSVWYKFKVSGLWTPDFRYGPNNLTELQNDPSLLSSVPWLVDARYVTEDSWINYSDFDPKGYADFGLYSTILGGDSDDFWGNYQSNHIYSYEVLGNGQSVDFYINDINYEDNFGGYTVNIYRAVPEPLTMLGAATAIGFGASFKRKLAKNSKKK